MKRLAFLITLIVLISACNLPTQGGEAPAAQPTVLETLPPAPTLPAPTLPQPTLPAPTQAAAVVPELEERTRNEESAAPAYTLEISYPYLLNTSQAAAFNALVDGLIKKDVDDFVAQVGENEEWRLQTVPDMISGLIIYDNVNLADEHFISVFFSFSPYIAGAAHPGLYGHVINFDLQSGTTLPLAALFTAGSDYLGTIAAKCREELEAREMLIFPEGADPVEANYQNWNLTAAGLTVHFDPYQVAPWVGGAPEVYIPYSELMGILDKAGPLAPYLQ